MGIKMIEPLSNGLFRETDFPSAQAIESENSRFEQFAYYRQAQVAASQTTTLATVNGVDANAHPRALAPRAGTLKGILIDTQGTITAGGASAIVLTVMLNGVATTLVGKIASGTGANATTQVELTDASVFPNPNPVVAFNKGDSIAVQVSSSGTLAPTTINVGIDVLVRWAP